MCRFVLYLGPPMKVSRLVTEPEHSLLRQSRDAHEGRERVNGDGFGLAWYALDGDPAPAVFRSTRPAWNNPNFCDLSRVVQSRCFMAHVRAATIGLGVTVANCHPFRADNLIFMHNGTIEGFSSIRRALYDLLSPTAFERICGTTDSEHVLALLTEHYVKTPYDADPAGRLAIALAAAIDDVRQLIKRHSSASAVTLNVAVADGESIAVARYANRAAGKTKSLYMIRADPLPGATERALVIASEPLDQDPRWEPFPSQSIACARIGEPLRIRPLRRFVREPVAVL